MRRMVTLPVCFALLMALCMAPFQHVHLAMGHSGLDHDTEFAIVHIHFGTIPVLRGAPDSSRITESDAEHAQALDTFTAIAQAVVFLAIVPESDALVLSPPQLSAGIVEAVEPRGHDPPIVDVSVPRAPPA